MSVIFFQFSVPQCSQFSKPVGSAESHPEGRMSGESTDDVSKSPLHSLPAFCYVSCLLNS